MTRINLLPWREMRRKEKQRQFISVVIGAAILAGVVMLYVHLHVSGMIGAQNVRNDYLKGEIKQVEAKIKEIQTIEAEKKSLLARMNVIQQLQSRRPEIVHLFYELMRNVPSGIYLTKISQNGTSLTIDGMAQSNARVSAFMRNLDLSDWLEDPKLDVIKVDSKNKQAVGRASNFTLHVTQASHAGPPEDGGS